MGYYNAQGVWVEGEAPAPTRPPRRTRQMRPVEERLEDANEGVREQARREQRQGRYDENGRWVEGAPANTAETLEDVGRSAVSGAQRGAAYTLGAPTDLANLWEDGVDALAGWVLHDVLDLDTRPRNTPEEQARLDRDRLAAEERARRDAEQEARRPYSTRGFSLPGGEEINARIQETFGEQHEPETEAGEYARTIGEFGTGALFPGGPAARVSRVVVPGAASEAAGDLVEGTPAEPWARLAGGLGGGIVNEGLIAVLSRQGLTPDERGLRLILRELNDQGMSTDEIVRQANVLLRQAPTEEVLLETLGEGGLRLARAVASMGRGAGRSVADDALRARAEGVQGARGVRPVTSIRDRILDEAARTTAPQAARAPRDYWDALDALRRARAGQGSDAYRAVYDQDLSGIPAVQERLLPYLGEAPREAAVSGARQLGSIAAGLKARRAAAQARGATAEVDALNAEIDDVVMSMRQLEQLGTGQLPNTLRPRTVDYFQRGLSQMERTAGMGSPEARAIGDARRAFNEMADEIVPGFRDARSRYGESMRIEELMNDGRRVFDMSDGEIDRLLRGSSGGGLGVEEFDGFMLGVMDAIERKLGASDTAFLARLMRNQNWRDQLTRAVGGPQAAQRFFDRLAREASMQNTRNFVQSGSRTQPLAEDIAALTQGESEFAFMSDNARQLIQSGGQVRPLVIRWVLGAYDRFNRPGLRDPAVQEALARQLFARVTRTSSRELRDALNAVQQDATVPDRVRQWLQRVNIANAATVDERASGGEDQGGDTLSQAYLEARRGAEESGGRNPIAIEHSGGFYVIPSMIDGRQLTPENARNRWFAGVNPEIRGGFATREEAEAYARSLTGGAQ